MVLFDGSQPAVQALKAATRFVGTLQSRLTVFLLPDKPQDVRSLVSQAIRHKEGKEVEVDFRPMFAADAQQLANAIEREDGGLLVLGRQYKHLAENEVQNLLRLVSNPVLLLRQAGATRNISVE